MLWLFHFCLLSVPLITAHGYGLSLRATPLRHMSLKSKSADLSPGLWQKSIFFLTHTHTTVLFRIHGHLVVPTGGCSMSCCSMDT